MFGLKEGLFREPEICDIPSIPVRSRRMVMTNFPLGLGDLMGGAMGELQAAGGMPAGAPILVYHDEVYDPAKVDVEAAWPVSDTALANATLPELRAVRYTHVGPYDQLEKVYELLMSWISEQGYRALMPMREVYPNDPATTAPQDLITEIIMPVEKL